MIKPLHLRVVLAFALGTLLPARATDRFHFSEPVWVVAPEQMPLLGPHCPFPAGVHIDTSNNNSAIFFHDSRLYFAFRSATHHHPKPPIWSPQWKSIPPWQHVTRLYVLSTALDGVDWKHFPKGFCEKLHWRVEFETHDRLAPLLAKTLDQDFDPIAKAWALDGTDDKLKFNLPRVREIFGAANHDRIVATLRQYLKAHNGELAPPPSTLLHDVKPSGVDYSTPFGPLPGFFDAFDLREPLFAEIDGKLFFYFQQIEGVAMRFGPLRTWTLQLDQDHWTAPQPVLAPGELVWEMKPHGDVLFLTSYSGGHYSREEGDLSHIHFRQSSNGVHWTSINPDSDTVYSGGGNETAFDFDAQGRLLALARHEDGGKAGWGSMLLHSDPPLLGKWAHGAFADPRRYDSPRLFRHHDHWYLIARQNIGAEIPGYNPMDNGFFANARRLMRSLYPQRLIHPGENYPFDLAYVNKDLKPDYLNGPRNRDANLRMMASGDSSNKSGNPFSTGFFYLYEHHYYFHEPKRTALYEIFPQTEEIRLLATLPSAGDTAFPSIVRLGLKEYLISNYSSELDKRTWSWRTGQENPTGIYFIKLTFSE